MYPREALKDKLHFMVRNTLPMLIISLLVVDNITSPLGHLIQGLVVLEVDGNQGV